MDISPEPPLWQRFTLFCSFLGAIFLLKFSLLLVHSIYVFFLRPRKNINQYGKWAVVTGPTDGIGKATAFELARHGFNLVLVARNPEKLQKVSSEIKSEVPAAEFRTVVIDFAQDTAEGVEQLKEEIKDLDVGILVNNAGLSQIKPRFFHEIEEEMWETLVKVNLIAPTIITSAVLPYMLQRRRGAIINVGSGSTVAVPSFPLYTVYTGTKGYISQLSKSMYQEYKKNGIHVQCQLPLFVLTKITPGLRSSFFVATPPEYAHSAIKCIGYESQFMPYWRHALQRLIFRYMLPEFLVDRLVLSFFMKHRQRVLLWEMKKKQVNS